MTDPDRSGEGTDPTRIRSIAVHREDVANALEATLRTEKRVVLRVTPPYSGRMRARIHRVDDASMDGSDGAIHVDAAAFLETVPPYPEVDETAAEFPDADVETRRERHAEAVAEWREAVREAVGGTVEIAIADGDTVGERTHEVDVVALG
ncbi:hypothetical protein SAMN04488066_10119 [Halorubrum aquaticum]|uniref:DUF8009 domain-containing protein n=1 Tax=Halorubrum aquaticum TaxID=387340 RepID=A0A1I2YXZ9_9EURY|nr:hypothetical protein [Halorubrum aquaticum]SFH30295.1 hypothetical protein SAMN04488066_10119 [Halorubrum aquaticum]